MAHDKAPTLLVQTVYFSDGDEPIARELGLELYGQLTRSRHDRLAFGPSIPVRIATNADAVDLRAAQNLLVVPVLGDDTFGDDDAREGALATMDAWFGALGPGHVMPVLASSNWRAVEDRIRARPSLRHLYQD